LFLLDRGLNHGHPKLDLIMYIVPISRRAADRCWSAPKWLMMALCALQLGCTVPRAAGTGPGQIASSTGVLELHCTYTYPYCGGAAPDPDMIPGPQPWVGRMFLRQTLPDSTGLFGLNDLDQPIVDTIRMGADGRGRVILPAGTYVLLDQEHVDDTKYKELIRDHAQPVMYTDPIDTLCLKQWLYGPFGLLTITAGDTLRQDLPMHGQCPWYETPCVSYHGPLPP
jgi:hypothetical protein